MFIHLGGNTVIRAREIIAIFNVDIEATSPTTATFLKQAKENGTVEVIAAEEMKSVVVTEERVYYSPISSLTLKRRSFDDYELLNKTDTKELGIEQ